MSIGGSAPMPSCARRYGASRSSGSSSPGRGGRVSSTRVALQQPARGGDLVDLVRAVVDAGAALVGPPAGQRRVVGDAERAVDLDGAVEHGLQHAGDEELDERDLDLRGAEALAVDLPGGVE